MILRYGEEALKTLGGGAQLEMLLLREEASKFGHFAATVTKCHGNGEYFMTVSLFVLSTRGFGTDRLRSETFKFLTFVTRPEGASFKKLKLVNKNKINLL